MSKKTPAVIESSVAPEAKPTLAPLPEVISAINKAGKAANSMLNATREAAVAAAKQLDFTLSIKDRIDAIMLCYGKALTGAGANVRAIFKDIITLEAAGTCPVSVEVVGKGGKKTEAQITAAEAVDLPKHAMRAAAQEVRQVHNMGRAKGGGRKPAAKTEMPKGVPAAPDMAPTDAEAFEAWLSLIPEYVTDAVYNPQIVAALAELGYELKRKPKVIRSKAA